MQNVEIYNQVLNILCKMSQNFHRFCIDFSPNLWYIIDKEKRKDTTKGKRQVSKRTYGRIGQNQQIPKTDSQKYRRFQVGERIRQSRPIQMLHRRRLNTQPLIPEQSEVNLKPKGKFTVKYRKSVFR